MLTISKCSSETKQNHKNSASCQDACVSLRQCHSTPLRKDAAGISPRLSRLPCQHSPARVVVPRHSPSPQQIVTSNSLDCKPHKRYHIISLIIKIFDSKTKSSLKLAHNAVQPHCAYRGTGHAGYLCPHMCRRRALKGGHKIRHGGKLYRLRTPRRSG